MKVFWKENCAVFCRFKWIIVQNASFFSIFDETHSTIGLIRKYLEHLVSLSAQQIQGEVP